MNLILIIDDDSDIRSLLKLKLKKKGYKVNEAANGSEGVDRFKDIMPDVTLVDLKMPDMDGIQVLSKIKEHSKEAEVIIITANEDIDTAIKAMRHGAFDYLTKPINTKALDITIKRALEKLGTSRKLEEYVQKLEHLAHFDTLTGIANRRMFLYRLSHDIGLARRHKYVMALLFIDLDRFKQVNDTLGHEVGDLLLKEVAERILLCIRKTDTAARLGGDEFTVILSRVSDENDVVYIARRIIESMSTPFHISGSTCGIGASIGICIYPNDASDTKSVLANADVAMYHAKEKGRNNFQFYSPEMNADALEHLKIETELKQALENDEFILCYQPQIDINTGEIMEAEALIRWQHPEKGLLFPGSFLPVAEETGLILDIGTWSLTKVCTQIKHWITDGISPVRISINLSSKQFQQKEMVATMINIIEARNIPVNLLEFELTEDVLMQDKNALATLNMFRGRGIHLAIDDFGTGYSSLQYLTHLPLDKLKIDRSFIKNIPTDKRACAIVEAVITIGHSLDLKVVAEGVETDEQLMFLHSRKCDLFQGFLCSKALQQDDFEYLLTTGSLCRAYTNNG